MSQSLVKNMDSGCVRHALPIYRTMVACYLVMLTGRGNHLPQDRSKGTGGFAELSGDGEFSSEFAETMRDVFLRVCHTLQVSDPADLLAAIITRTIISLAAQGESNPDELYKRALNEFRPN